MRAPGDDVALWEGVRRAEQSARLTVGDTVCHRDEPYAMTLLEVRGETAICAWGNSPEMVRVAPELREYPLSSLFDPNVARDYAVSFVMLGESLS